MFEETVSSNTQDGSKEPSEDVRSDSNTPEQEDLQPDQSEAHIAALQEEIAALKEQLLRTLAEAENTRKRTFKEKEESVKYAVHGFARELLAVADNLSRALQTIDGKPIEVPEFSAFSEGVGMTERELLKVFEKHHITKITPKPGDAFDPNMHQAMFEVETDLHPAGAIAEVMQNGYSIYERLLRPALVGVAKSSQSSHVDKSI
ncbi:MAG: nucleotide exchange factor GrpE [Alphaproteobacteria bacterium]|nr:nucleotide exchange factor GrpE [Alphaproteobacteria bacterium]